jgi:peptidoglycan/xylan/chitin deacetylase (PgdA/CDA1 family)
MRLWIAVLCALTLLPVSCKRIEDKLDRLAKAAGLVQEPPKPAEPELTPEQLAMEKRLLDAAAFDLVTEADIAPKAVPFELNKSSVVSILGYHDFRERGGSPMIIAADKFRTQMQAIKDSGIPVIPLSDVLAWRRGEKNIPEEAFVITMDDGWQGVYQHAFPVLKEFGFPFTVYLYKKYVNIGGRSLTWEQVREMMRHGCEVGSHSVSHESLRGRKGGRDAAAQQAWVLAELQESKAFLEQHLGVPCRSFAYPFGIFDEGIAEAGLKAGYEALVTVNSQKVIWDSPMAKLGRFIVHGESDANFKLATSFSGRGDIASSHFLLADAKDAEGRALVELSPAADAVTAERLPKIEARLQRVGTVLPESVRLRVAGLGLVPARYDPASMMVSYKMPVRLRRDDCAVTLSFKKAADQPEEVLSWRFKIDLTAAYQPQPILTDAKP